MNNSAISTSIPQSSDQILRLGFVVGLPADCLVSSKALLDCSDWRLRLSGYYLQLLWGNKPFNITVFPAIGKVWDAMDAGDIDVYLVGHPLDENLVKRVHPTSMLYRSVDVMFTGAPDVQISGGNPFTFWASIFNWETWISVVAIFLLLVIVFVATEKVAHGHIRKVTSVFRPGTAKQVRRYQKDHQYFYTRRTLEGTFLLFAMFFTIYDSNVKAMLYTSTSKVPFTSLIDLADQIRQGQKRMVLERKDTDRWRMLVNLNETDFYTVKYLRNAVSDMNALSFIPQVSDLCRQLSLDPTLVYFGSEKITESSCPEYCLWKFELQQEELAKPVYFVVSRKTLRSGKLDQRRVNMYLHALHNYGEVVAKRGHNTAICDSDNVGAAYINMDSLIAFVYLCSGLWSVGFGILVLENIWFRLRGRQQVNSGYSGAQQRNGKNVAPVVFALDT